MTFPRLHTHVAPSLPARARTESSYLAPIPPEMAQRRGSVHEHFVAFNSRPALSTVVASWNQGRLPLVLPLLFA